MPGPLFRVELRVLSTEKGGRTTRILSDYRPNWDLGNTWLGAPSINDGRVFLEDCTEIVPGGEGLARIEPLAPEFWGRVRPGSVIPMQEGSRVVGYARILGIVSCPDYWTPAVAVFVDQARQFCDFVEKASEYSLDKRLICARQRLLELYETGFALPHVNAPDIEEGASPQRPRSWPGFGKFETYWEVFDPYEDTAPVAGSLSDDVLDVYGDLQRGLALWDKESARTAAIWDWRFHFDNHWGDHAIDALRALHRACGHVRR